MKDKLTKVLESMNYPYFQQGTMNKEEGYPESYFTFKNMSSDGDAFYNYGFLLLHFILTILT